jgi:predicted O-methyltransferase YrrM
MKFDLDAIIKASKNVSYNFRDDILKSVDIEYSRYFMEEPSYFKLLTATAMLYPDAQFFDIGTYRGASAVAYLYGKPNTLVHTYDIQNANQFIHDGLRDKIKVVHGDCRTMKFDVKPDIIYLDISHNGDDEANTLMSLDAQGMLKNCMVILDDIHLNDNMKRLWAGIESDQKVDITKDGHSTGTGVFINYEQN